ncbi:unnamed protein product [Caenorhabditis nigoni]|uniref:DUF38 domain-containing protein n=1 Tax=Caenorhabditis nigoni TaxID=1611254 RepID=A0A2G5TD06_9PELO|nr:hypothetical protein B9Z55_018142 [Caenorhabditis nigoni]
MAPSLAKLMLSNETSLKVLGNSLIMEKVLKYSNAFDIHSFRKTCHGIRTCVDDLKLDPQFEVYVIYMITDKKIDAAARVTGYKTFKSISYEQINDCENIITTVLAVLEMNLKNQKACLEELRLVCSFYEWTVKSKEPLETLIPEKLVPITSEFLAGFKEILKRRSGLLKVKKLNLYSVREEDVMQVLPYLDPKSLEKLQIGDSHWLHGELYHKTDYPESLKISYDIEEMTKTEQWKNLRQVTVNTGILSTPIQKMNLTNCSKIYITSVARITSDDVVYLKENLLTPKLQSCTICFEEFVEDPQLTEFFGQPRYIERAVVVFKRDRRIWYFPIPGANGSMMEIDLDRKLCLENVDSFKYE